jgi:hypothetical protein
MCGGRRGTATAAGGGCGAETRPLPAAGYRLAWLHGMLICNKRKE